MPPPESQLKERQESHILAFAQGIRGQEQVREWSLLIFQELLLFCRYLDSFGKTRIFLNNQGPLMSDSFFGFISLEYSQDGHVYGQCSRCENRTGLWDRGSLLRRGNNAGPFSQKACTMAMTVTLPSP